MGTMYVYNGMERPFTTALRAYSERDVSENLETRILYRVAKARARQARIEASVFGVGSVLTFGGALMLLTSVHTALVASGFYAYLTLVFSGDSVVYTFWSELAYALVESVPSLPMGITLILSMLFVWSFGETVHRIPMVRVHRYA